MSWKALTEKAKAAKEERVEEGERGEQIRQGSERKLGNLALNREWERALKHSWLTEGYNDCHIAMH